MSSSESATDPVWLVACRIFVVRPDKQFTGDDFLDAEVNREIARRRRERREAEQSQRPKPKQQSNDASRATSKAPRTKGRSVGG